MTIESLAHDCFKRSGYAINKQDLISRIEFLCEQYHQSKVNNIGLGDVSNCCGNVEVKFYMMKNIKVHFATDVIKVNCL